MSRSRLEVGAPRRAVQLCYWQIGAGQHAAGLSRRWHIKAPGPIASPPVAPQSATSKGFWAHRRFPSKGLDAELTHTSKPAKEIWLKAHYWGKEGGQKRGLARMVWREKKTGYQTEGIIFSLSLSFFIIPQIFKTIREKKDARLTCYAALPSHNLFSKCLLFFYPSLSSFTLWGHVSGHLI